MTLSSLRKLVNCTSSARALIVPVLILFSFLSPFQVNFFHTLVNFVPHSYDDMTYPSDIRYHNRFYLDYVPRDKFDEFAWTLLDSQIRSGNFDRDEWAFTLRRPVPLLC